MSNAANPLPPCAVCAGKAPVNTGGEVDEETGITAQRIYYQYPGEVRTNILSMISPSTTVIAQAERLKDSKSGATALLHYCFDRGHIVIYLEAPLPQGKADKKRLAFFFNYAQKTKETRGRKRAFTIEDVFAVIRRRPGAGRVWVAAELGVTERTIQDLLKSAGLTFAQAKKKAL